MAFWSQFSECIGKHHITTPRRMRLCVCVYAPKSYVRLDLLETLNTPTMRITEIKTNLFLWITCHNYMLSVCRWDEWVHEDHVLEYNDSNIRKQKRLRKKYGATNKKGQFHSLVDEKRCKRALRDSQSLSPSTSSSAASTSNQKRSISRGAPERDSRVERPKYVNRLQKHSFDQINSCTSFVLISVH